MCIWGVELQTEGGWIEGAQTRSVPAASVSSRPTRHSPVPPILPTSPLGPLCWQWDSLSLPDHPSRTADGQGSPDQSFLGSALAYSAGTPCLGGCQLFPVLPRWHPPSGHCGWLSAVLQRCPHPWNAAGTGASLPQAVLQPPRVTSPGPQRGCELGLVCIPH